MKRWICMYRRSIKRLSDNMRDTVIASDKVLSADVAFIFPMNNNGTSPLWKRSTIRMHMIRSGLLIHIVPQWMSRIFLHIPGLPLRCTLWDHLIIGNHQHQQLTSV